MKVRNSDRSWDKYSDEDWRKILLGLRRYAKAKCTIMPSDQEPDDVASEALIRVLQGSRTWNQEKNPEISSLLQATVDSIVSKIWKKVCNRDRLRETREYTNLTAMEKLGSHEVESSDGEEEFRRRLDELRGYAEGDEDLEDFFLAVEYGNFSRDEIARHLGWEVGRVDNAKKRLKRRIKKANEQRESREP